MDRMLPAVLAIAAGILAIPRPARCETPALAVVARIPLPGGKGRIDHLAYDSGRRRLYVAELGNDSVAVVDIAGSRLERRWSGLAEPQGIAYSAATDTVYVATGGDGVIHAFRASDGRKAASVDVGEDADNVRVDSRGGRVYAGFGSGALAALDPRTLARLGEIPLEGHPEGFQLSSAGPIVFVNVPDSREIAVVDRSSAKRVTGWTTGGLRGNFPMALDAPNGEVISVFRSPAAVVAYRMATGEVAGKTGTCADADDVFVDERRQRIYVVCGAGYVDVLQCVTLERIQRFPTRAGARTGWFAADADRLFVAVRASSDGEAAVWVLEPQDGTASQTGHRDAVVPSGAGLETVSSPRPD